jgi:hypothetical protein
MNIVDPDPNGFGIYSRFLHTCIAVKKRINPLFKFNRESPANPGFFAFITLQNHFVSRFVSRFVSKISSISDVIISAISPNDTNDTNETHFFAFT